MAAAKKKSYQDEVLGRLNKDKETVQAEIVKDTVEDFTIECEAQISLIKASDIPSLTSKVTRAKRTVTKAKKALTESKYDISSGNFASFVGNINHAQAVVTSAENEVKRLSEQLAGKKAELKRMEELLATLKS